MQDKMSAVSPGGLTDGATPRAHESAEGVPHPVLKRRPRPDLNKRLPRGENLPGYAAEYFNQLVAQYYTLPAIEENARNANARAVADTLIGEQEQEKVEQERRGIRWPWERKKHYLTWGDVSGMEMALLQLLPETHLQRYAWNLRARYHEVAGQRWYDFYQQSKPPDGLTPPEVAGDVVISITGIPPGASGLFLLTPPTQAPPEGDSPAAAGLRADLSILLSDLQRLRSTIKAREEKHSRISLIGALLAVVSLTLALGFYSIPSLHGAWAAERAAPARVALAPVPPPTGLRPTGPAASSAGSGAAAAPNPAVGVPNPAAAAWRTLRILQMSALVILCGVLGGLISMLRRLQALPPGSTPLFDTIALDAGQLGIGLAPIYGGIFAMVLYLVFLSGLPASIIAASVEGVFPKFTDATPATTPDAAKLLVWSFVAGFAEQLVPDVLNRLTARNAAKAAGAAGADPPPK